VNTISSELVRGLFADRLKDYNRHLIYNHRRYDYTQ
jgi:hypothetical protein